MSKIIQKKAAEQALTNKVKQQESVSEANVPAVQTRKRKADTEGAKQAPKSAKKGGNKGTASNDSSSVIYLGHLPHGFFEPQLKKFFMQFGIVRKLKLFRSPKTGGSRGFAFLQFESPDTAQTVADAMHGYFLHDRQLVAHVVPSGKHHEGMWKMKKPTEEMLVEAGKEEESEKKADPESVKKAHEALLKRMAEKQNKLDAAGIDFQIPALSC